MQTTTHIINLNTSFMNKSFDNSVSILKMLSYVTLLRILKLNDYSIVQDDSTTSLIKDDEIIYIVENSKIEEELKTCSHSYNLFTKRYNLYKDKSKYIDSASIAQAMINRIIYARAIRTLCIELNKTTTIFKNIN